MVAFQSQCWAVGSSGFENATYSARSIAQSNAVVARPDEPDAVVFNPAGLPDLPGVQLSVGGAAINTLTHFQSKGTGRREKSSAQLAFVPNFFLTANPGEILDDRVGFGLGMTAPFGLQNRYNSTDVFSRYTGHRNALKMVAITLAGGLKLSDKLSIGGAAVDYVTFKYDQISNFPNSNVLAGIIGPNNAPDGVARLDSDGYGLGWTLGALYKPSEKHRIGFYYRSRATVEIDGEVRIEGLNPLLFSPVLGNLFPTGPDFKTQATSDLPLPPNITVGYAYVPSDKWAIEFDVGYTMWNVFKDQDFAFEITNVVLQNLGRVPRDYDNTWSFHLGGHYKINDKLDLMAGTLYYTAASPKEHVDNVLVDSHRMGWSLGLRWNITENMSLDTAYLGLFHFSRNIQNSEVFAKTGLNIDGRYTSYTNDFIVNFTYRFDHIPFFEKQQSISNS